MVCKARCSTASSGRVPPSVFVIQNPDITEQTLKNAPDAVHCTGRIGVPSVDFDMRKLPTIVHEMSRSRSLPEIAYKADNFQFRSLELLNRQGLAGNTFRFPFPYELRNVAGSSSSYKCGTVRSRSMVFHGLQFVRQWHGRDSAPATSEVTPHPSFHRRVISTRKRMPCLNTLRHRSVRQTKTSRLSRKGSRRRHGIIARVLVARHFTIVAYNVGIPQSH